MQTRAWVAAAMGFLTIAMIQRLMAMVFVLNFDTAGPNATAAMAALLITAPWWLRTSPGARAALAGLAFGAVLAASFSSGVIAALGAAVALMAMMPLWRAVGHLEGAVVGALVWMTSVAFLGALSPFHVMPGLVVAAALVLLAWVRLEGKETRAPASLWMFLLVQAVWLASLPTLWRWIDTDPTTMAVAAAGGLAIGLWVRPLPWRGWADITFLAGMALALTGFAPAIGVFAAQLASVRLLGEGGGVGRLVLVQVGAVVFLFMHVVAGNWAFVGFVPEALSRGLAGLYLFLLAALLPVAAWRRA